MLKRIVCLGLGLLMLFCLTACNINMENVAGLKRQIADLEAENSLMDERIAGLEAEKALLQQEIDVLKAENTQQDEKIAELEDWLFRLAKRLDELTDNGEWTNENALYAGVKEEYVNEVLEDVEGAFAYLDFKAVYIVEKQINREIKSLRLLFVLYESGSQRKEEFAKRLRLDEKINLVDNCYDVPFKTVDTLYLDAPTYTIKVDETIDITLKGEYKQYHQMFRFDYFWVELSDFDGNKTYTPADFPQVSLASIKQYSFLYGLYLNLSEPGYFNLIKAIDALSRISVVENIRWENIPSISPGIDPPNERIMWWTWPDPIGTAVVKFVASDNTKATIKGFAPGTVRIDCSSPSPRSISCEITVVE